MEKVSQKITDKLIKKKCYSTYVRYRNSRNFLKGTRFEDFLLLTPYQIKKYIKL